jgi:choline dehydrogenase
VTCPRTGWHASHVRSDDPTAQATSGWPRPTPESSRPFTTAISQHPNDRRRVRAGLRLAVRLLESPAYTDVAEYRMHPTAAMLADDDALARWIRQPVGTARHVSGTCQMGPDADPLAGVDQYGRVKGVHGLWVVDASVMPRIPRSGGTHATVLMSGERVVDWIAGRVPVSHG